MIRLKAIFIYLETTVWNKHNFPMRFDTSVTIGYKNVFDDFNEVSISRFLKDIPTNNSLEIIGYFLAQIHFNERDERLQFDFLKIWLSRLPIEISEKVMEFTYRQSAKATPTFNLINNVSALILMEYIIENHNDLERISNLMPEQELNLFKAYLYCTQIWLDEQLTSYKGQEIHSVDEFLNVILPAQLPYSELLEFKDFISQSYKAIYFFKFCESNSIFQEYLKLFLNAYNLKSWQDYLFNLLKLYIRKYERLKVPSILTVDKSFPDIINFLSHLSIDVTNFKRNYDFLGIRERPIFKMSQGKYLFLNLNFLIDKIFQGIQFDFAKILINNKVKFKHKPLKSFPDFKSVYGTEFSEPGLFYEIMDYVFEKYHYVKLNGDLIKKCLGGGGPDYYLRDRSKIFLFEYKDILLSATVKYSFDFEKIKIELFNKLVENEEGDAKGVSQLINAIVKIRDQGLNSYDGYDFGKATYYPMIVYTDSCLNLGGINYILNKKFRELLIKRNIKNSYYIKDLVLIDIDTFIKFQDYFHDKKIRLNSCLNDFYNYTRSKNKILNQVGTFDYYLNYKTRNLPHEVPRIIKTEIPKLYKNH